MSTPYSDGFQPRAVVPEGLKNPFQSIGHFPPRSTASTFLAGSEVLWTDAVLQNLKDCIQECNRDDVFAREVLSNAAQNLQDAAGEEIIHTARTFAFLATANPRLMQLGTRELKVRAEKRVRELDNKIDLTDPVLRNLSYASYGTLGIGVEGHALLTETSILGGLIELAIVSPDRSDPDNPILYQKVAQHSEGDPFIPAIRDITQLGEGILLQEFYQNLFARLIDTKAQEPLSIQGLSILASVFTGKEDVAAYIALRYVEQLNDADSGRAFFLGAGVQACYEYLIDEVADPFEQNQTAVRNAQKFVAIATEHVQYQYREIVEDLSRGEDCSERVKTLITFSGQLGESVQGLLSEFHETPKVRQGEVIDQIFQAGLGDAFAQYTLCRSGLAVKLHEIAQDIDPGFAKKVRDALHKIFLDEFESIGFLVNGFFEILPFLTEADFRATMRAFRGAARVRAAEKNDSDEFLSSTLLSMRQILKRGSTHPIAVTEFVRLASALCAFSNENFYDLHGYRYFFDLVPGLHTLSRHLPAKQQRKLNQHFRNMYSKYLELHEERPWLTLLQDLPGGCIASVKNVHFRDERNVLLVQCTEKASPRQVAGALMGLHMQNHRAPVVGLGEAESLKMTAQMVSKFEHNSPHITPYLVPVQQPGKQSSNLIADAFANNNSNVQIIQDPAEVEASGFTMAVLNLPSSGEILAAGPLTKAFLDVQNAERLLLVAQSVKCHQQIQRVLDSKLDLDSPFGRLFSGREVCILVSTELMYELGFED